MKSDLNKSLILDSVSIAEKSLSILLVEDNPGDVILIKEYLNSSGIDFTIQNVSTLKETLLLCVEKEFDVILLDLGLTDSTGLETLKKIQVFNVKSPVVVMTGLDDEDVALESLRQGAQDYLVKSKLNSDNILKGIKYSIERKKIQDMLARNARQFSMLSSTTTAISECEDESSVFEITCRNISTLLENAGTFGLEMHNPGRFYSSGLEHIKTHFNQIKGVTGLNLHETYIDPLDYKKDLLDLFTDGKLHKISDQSPESPDKGKISDGHKRVENISDIHIYTIGFTRNEIIYGGLLIFSHNNIGMEDVSIIETISNQVSLTLHRKDIENDLKISENKYRKLSRDLEKKVKERTRDLESSNYQLNQELIVRHLAEEALRKSETRLKELNATKDKFFNIIAHDLKNPFTSLMGSTEILMDGFNTMDYENIMELVQIVNDSAKSGYAILQNLLDWTRSQTGSITFRPERLDLKGIVDDNISDIRILSDRKGITVVSEVKRDMTVFADKNMMDSILRNLIGNAVKFTQKSGKVVVSAAASEDVITITVRDTGIGIPEEKIKELFRMDSYYTRPGTNMESGTGLGLKLCKEFIELQGGKIRVESTVNKGSKFIFSLPLKES